ncbi:hypothetical protein K438DRAFT_1782578 [Mycena galopus ATCC 62051]|nr:hypothetical protein K438DRAFT_1782578 [Mycena galopus ATCC 62051]
MYSPQENFGDGRVKREPTREPKIYNIKSFNLCSIMIREAIDNGWRDFIAINCAPPGWAPTGLGGRLCPTCSSHTSPAAAALPLTPRTVHSGLFATPLEPLPFAQYLFHSGAQPLVAARTSSLSTSAIYTTIQEYDENWETETEGELGQD